MRSFIKAVTGAIRRASYTKTVVVDGNEIEINLDGSGFAKDGDTLFAFDLSDDTIFKGDSLNMDGRNVDVVEIDGVTYIKNIGSGS